MPGIEIKGRSKRANYRHGGRTGFKEGSKKVYTKAIKEVRKILGGGAELRGGGRAVMKKGGKV